jgi:TPR repeat protein
MGIVYLAEHTLLGEQRALKFLSGTLASNPNFVQRFLQEARAANKLRHPNIAQTLELGQSEDGSFYISMEFVDGPSLRALLDQSPFGLPPDRAFNIVRGVAEALGAAHAKHMVHRDIKPENILLAWTTESETAKVVDFGIVAITDGVGRLTQTGRPLMTAQYAAPEQWRGVIPPSDLDGRTDLYALGCMFYEMLTGQLPYHSDTYEGWFEQHVHGIPVPPSQIRSELAQFHGLDALVLTLIAKEREDRPANVREFLADLDRAIVPQAAETRPSGEGLGHQSGKRSQTVIEFSGQSAQIEQSASSRDQNQAGGAARKDPPRPYVPPPVSQSTRWWIRSLVALMLLLAIGAILALVLRKDDPSSLSSATISDLGNTPNAGSGNDNIPAPLPKPQAANPQASSAEPGSQFPVYSPQSSQPAATVQPDAAATAKQAIALYTAKQYSQSEPLFQQACSGGHADSCDYLGWMYQYHLGVDQDYSKALLLYEKGCASGSLAACNNEGVMYENHIGVAEDFPKALALYTRSCDGDFAIACDSLGSMYEFHEGVPQNYPRAVTLYTKACNGGSMNGCKNLGWMYQYKLGVEQDYPRAVTLYTKACDGGNLSGCNNLGYMYQRKLGVAQDYPKALALFAKACDGGEASSCNSLGIMYEEGQGTQEDDLKAVSLYTRSCDAGHPNGCSDLGNMYRYGKGVPKDTDKAKALLSKGCTMGSSWGCDSLKEMH